MPLTIGIVVVLGIVVISYQQTIRAYPSGGGSYIVANENLGPLPGLIAAGALLTDYVLTVAVSIAAGVAALTSIFPGLFDGARGLWAWPSSGLLWIGNLRGIRESGTIFAIPTYIYLVAIAGLLGYGHLAGADRQPAAVRAHRPAWALQDGTEALGLLLDPAGLHLWGRGADRDRGGLERRHRLREPAPRNARSVLLLMGGSFAIIFLGISFLAGQLGIVPDPREQRDRDQPARRHHRGGGQPRTTTWSRSPPPAADPRRQHRVQWIPAPRRDPGAATASCRASSSSGVTAWPTASGLGCWP